MADVAVLGIGRMGGAMARRLVSAGHQVTLWNRTAAAADQVSAETGATRAETASDAVSEVDVVVAMLATGDATREVLLDPALLSALRPGTIVCDMATSGVDVAHDLARGLAEAGARFVDAPVSGSVPSIEAGQLLVMASGDPETVVELEPTVLAFAKKVTHLGPAGAGQGMKLAVNLVVHALNSAVAEALVLAESAGVAPEAAYDVLENSAVAAPFVTYKRRAFLDVAAPVAMSLALTAKDLGLITERARSEGLRTLVADAVRAEVQGACAAGWGDQDMAALARFLGQDRIQP